MKTMKTGNCRGSALVTVLIVLTTVTAYLGIVVSSSLQRAYSATKLADRVRAQLVAEAGVTKAYSILVTNWSARIGDESFPEIEYAGGKFDCTVIPNETLNMAKIACIGTYGKDQITVIMDVKNNGSPTAGTDGSLSAVTNAAYGYGILAGCDIEFNGGSGFNLGNGKVHANGVFLKGGNGDLTAGELTFRESTILNGTWNIIANVRCDKNITTKGSGDFYGNVECDVLKLGAQSVVNGNKVLGNSVVDNVTIPLIDLTPYYNIALANGQVYGSSQVLVGNITVEPEGGVMWVNGRLDVRSTGTMKGCFIATESIDISGSIDFAAKNGYPLLVSRDGDIDISGGGTYVGLIYAKNGNFEKNGDGDVNGSVICGGSFLAGGNWAVLNYTNVAPPIDPNAIAGVSGSCRDVIGVSAWQR